MSYTSAKKAIANKKPSSADNLVGLVKSFTNEIKAALPKHIGSERMTRIIMTEVRKNPKLAECDQASFLGAILVCSQLGLEPGVALGHAFLLPQRNKGKMEVQLIVGYQGMIDLAERSGKVTIDAAVIYENDEFSYTKGLNPTLDHKPAFGSGGKGEVIGAYAVARYCDGRCKFEVLDLDDINNSKKSSKSANSDYSPWKSHFAAMAKKTAVRQLFKMIPKSAEMAQVQEMDDKVEIDKPQDLGLLVSETTTEKLPTEEIPTEKTVEVEAEVVEKKDTPKKSKNEGPKNAAAVKDRKLEERGF